MPVMASILLTTSVALLCSCNMAEPDLPLAAEGKTAYQVVKPDASSTVDDYAIRVLTNNLQKITGAEFPVVMASEMSADKPAIYVGLSKPALKRLGRKPLSGLVEEEHVSKSIGRDIFLYGQGTRGNFYAVMDFLENSLGWRWFSVLSNPVTPSRPAAIIPPFNRKRKFSFNYRNTLPYFYYDYYYQHGINMTYAWVKTNPNWTNMVARGIVPAGDGISVMWGAHSLFQYIPPRPDSHLWEPYQWITNRNYFATNPDYFTMNPGGARVAQQLCFGNRALRDEFTRRVLEHINRLGENAIIAVGAEDSGGTFCHCEACKKLCEQYDSPAGAYFDYLMELCGLVHKRHPGVTIRGLAYRREQTQKPPKLPEGQRFPDNFAVLFAPIDDAYLGDWSQPDPGLQETYRDFLGWSKIVSAMYLWLYPTPYGTGRAMPVGNARRMITSVRLAHQAGVRAIFSEEVGVLQGNDFSELQAYLFLKLTRDVNADTDVLIREFTDSQYGSAGAIVRKYLSELEQGRLEMKTMPRGMTYSSGTFDPAFWPYLTPANLRRWQEYFDEMEKLCAGHPTELANVQRLRRNLDFATLFKWLELVKAYPDYFTDYTVHSRRITAVENAKRKDLAFQPRPIGGTTISVFESIIRGGGEKPLPPEFAGIDRQRIRTFLPEMRANDKYHNGYFDDAEAAFGYAPSVHRPDLPFTFGFYQTDTRKDFIRRVVQQEEIVPGKYKLYKLGAIVLTPKSQIWFSVKSWSTAIALNDLWEPGDPNEWDAWASIKFQGPAYGGTPVKDLRSGEENLVLVDRVILVKK